MLHKSRLKRELNVAGTRSTEPRSTESMCSSLRIQQPTRAAQPLPTAHLLVHTAHKHARLVLPDLQVLALRPQQVLQQWQQTPSALSSCQWDCGLSVSQSQQPRQSAEQVCAAFRAHPPASPVLFVACTSGPSAPTWISSMYSCTYDMYTVYSWDGSPSMCEKISAAARGIMPIASAAMLLSE